MLRHRREAAVAAQKQAKLAEQRAADSDQTMFDSAMNLLGAPWNMARAAAPHMSAGGSIINVSTSLSRLQFQGIVHFSYLCIGRSAFSQALNPPFKLDTF